MNPTVNLYPTLVRYAKLKHASIDRLAVQDAVESISDADPVKQLHAVTDKLVLKGPSWTKKADPSSMPVIINSQSDGWGILRGKNAQGQWVSEWWCSEDKKWNEVVCDGVNGYDLVTLKFSAEFSVGKIPAYQLVKKEIFSHKKLLIEAILGGVVINTVALATSFYTMQVYDRVVPTGATQTLMVLTIGVMISILYELFSKKVRAKIYDRLIDNVDQRLAHTIYKKFLSIRIDQLPQSVGGMASQMRGYETVRSFLTSVTTLLMVDAPFALIFVMVVAMIAGWLAIIPLSMLAMSITVGIYYRSRVDSLAGNANAASNFKTGLLVETVEGAETIKSGQGGWRMLSRWMKTTDEAREYELEMRQISEHSQYMIAAFQQMSYVLLVASGALLVSRGDLTMGGLIACSILSGRIMSPVAAISNQLVQWAHTKAALKGLDDLWTLEDDHHGQEQPLVPTNINGHYRFENVSVSYTDKPALSVPSFTINPGEKVGILGPVGSGKTTLLRLLSGMYKPNSGRIHIDSVDLSHVSKPVLSENIGYVQQDGRLFAGTLRDNLILGLIDPGDDAILTAAKKTGLLYSVIMPHPQGLHQPIFEGGTGLSGGQKQLVNLTRAFLRKPNIWLLDEPTASMDRNLERHVLKALSSEVQADNTLVVVTHKPEILELVKRIVVVSNQRIIIDDVKDSVIRKLRKDTLSKTKTA
ncbi:MAG: ATP-binding cassette domain-containing protein [Sedimenticola sp.]